MLAVFNQLDSISTWQRARPERRGSSRDFLILPSRFKKNE